MSFCRLCKTKTWRKSKMILYEYRQLYNLYKNRRHLKKMLKQNLILQVNNSTSHYQKGKNNKVID